MPFDLNVNTLAMSEEKRKKFSLSRVLRRRQADGKSYEVGINLLHPVSNGGSETSDQSSLIIDRFHQVRNAYVDKYHTGIGET
jgi:hypothetical protein